MTAVASTGPSGRRSGSLEMTSGPAAGSSVGPAVRALDQARVERDHVHQVPEAEGLLREPPPDLRLREPERRVEEQLHRVVARLPVDVDGPREVGRAGVVQPVVVGEPAVGPRHGDQLARPRVVEPRRALPVLVEHALDAGQALQEALDLGHPLRPPHVDVGDLVVRHREGLGGAGVEQLAPELGAHLDELRLPERAVHVDGAGHRRDAVLGQHDHARPVPPRVGDQLARRARRRPGGPGAMAGSRGPSRWRL